MTNAPLEVKKVSAFYGTRKAISDVTVEFLPQSVHALIGPSGCGKSTLLRSMNRMNDFVKGFRIEGQILYHGIDLYHRNTDPVMVRKKIGMVFQKPNPFPSSIYRNIIWGPKINGFKGNRDELVESSLRKAGLWDEVKDRLNASGYALSGGQQQRLCIARAIAMDPEVILMDEPCASLDPTSTARVEELIAELRSHYAIVIVTHNLPQAMRISDRTSFMYQGELIETNDTQQLFSNPQQNLTREYVTGHFG